MKKIFCISIVLIVVILSTMFFNINITKANSINSLPPLLSINNAKTIAKTCVKYQPLDYQPCSLFIPKGKYVFVYIYTVQNYYKIVYIQSFINGIPKGIEGWAESKTIKYNCCQ